MSTFRGKCSIIFWLSVFVNISLDTYDVKLYLHKKTTFGTYNVKLYLHKENTFANRTLEMQTV